MWRPRAKLTSTVPGILFYHGYLVLIVCLLCLRGIHVMTYLLGTCYCCVRGAGGGGGGFWGYSRANHPRWVLVNDTMPAPCVIVLQQVVLFLKIVRSQNLLERIGFIS